MKELISISEVLTRIDKFLAEEETNNLKISSKSVTTVYRKIEQEPINEKRIEDKQNNFAIANNKKRMKEGPPPLIRNHKNNMSPTGAEGMDEMEKDFTELNKAIEDSKNGIAPSPFLYKRPKLTIAPTSSSNFTTTHTQQESNSQESSSQESSSQESSSQEEISSGSLNLIL